MDSEKYDAQVIEIKTPTGMTVMYCNNRFCHLFGKSVFHDHNHDWNYYFMSPIIFINKKKIRAQVIFDKHF